MIGPNDDILNYVDDYVHGLLTPEDAETVRRFCETSRLGRAALEESQRRYEALQSLPPVEASEELIQQTVRHVAGRRPVAPRFARFSRARCCWPRPLRS